MVSTAFTRTQVVPGVCAMGQWKSFAIFVWHARADAPSASEAVAFGNQVMNRHPLFTPLHVVEETAGLPTPEGRDALLAPARVNRARTACIGVLLPEATLVAAMMRVFVRAASVILRGEVETVVAPNVAQLVREVLAVHQRRTGERIAAGELAAAIDAVRRIAV